MSQRRGLTLKYLVYRYSLDAAASIEPVTCLNSLFN